LQEKFYGLNQSNNVAVIYPVSQQVFFIPNRDGIRAPISSQIIPAVFNTMTPNELNIGRYRFLPYHLSVQFVLTPLVNFFASILQAIKSI